MQAVADAGLHADARQQGYYRQYQRRLMSMTLTDNRGFEADQLDMN